MSYHSVWNFLKRKFGLSDPPRTNSNASNCTHEDPPSSSSSSLNCHLDTLPVTSPTSLKPKRCRMEGPSNHLPSESVEAFAALCQLLTCSVCLEISHQANQCANGHLICLACSAQLEQSAFTAGRACNCPVCRVSLSGWGNDSLTGADAGNPNGTLPGLQRCLLAERLAAELPTACKFCGLQFPRRAIDRHRGFLCENRKVACPYSWLGCRWRGGAVNLSAHLKSCRLLNGEDKPWMRLAARQMQSVSERTAARLQPWRGLLRLLRNRQHVHFGVRGLTGLRMIHLPVVMSRLRRPGRNGATENSSVAESSTYTSPVLCLPTGSKSSIWVQFELFPKPLEGNLNEVQSQYEVAVKATYRVEFRQCAKRPNMRRPAESEHVLASNHIFYTLASLSSEGVQELEVLDCWHGFNEPTLAEGSGSEDSESASGHTVNFLPADADSFPNYTVNVNSADIGTALRSIEPVTSENLFGRDTLCCSYLLAIDPKLFTQKRSDESSRALAAPGNPNNSQHVVRPHVELVLQTRAGEEDDDDDEEEEEEDDDEEEEDDDDVDEEDEGGATEEEPAADLRSATFGPSRETDSGTNVNDSVRENDSHGTISLSEQIVALRQSTRQRRSREHN